MGGSPLNPVKLGLLRKTRLPQPSTVTDTPPATCTSTDAQMILKTMPRSAFSVVPLRIPSSAMWAWLMSTWLGWHRSAACWGNLGEIWASHVAGRVSGAGYVGGLAGFTDYTSEISGSHFSGTVAGRETDGHTVGDLLLQGNQRYQSGDLWASWIPG